MGLGTIWGEISRNVMNYEICIIMYGYLWACVMYFSGCHLLRNFCYLLSYNCEVSMNALSVHARFIANGCGLGLKVLLRPTIGQLYVVASMV